MYTIEDVFGLVRQAIAATPLVWQLAGLVLLLFIVYWAMKKAGFAAGLAVGYQKAKGKKEGENLPARAAWLTISRVGQTLNNQLWLADSRGTIFEKNRIQQLALLVESHVSLRQSLEGQVVNALAERDYEKKRADKAVEGYNELLELYHKSLGNLAPTYDAATANVGAAMRLVKATGEAYPKLPTKKSLDKPKEDPKGKPKEDSKDKPKEDPKGPTP